VQETRLWDPSSKRTTSMRSKEEAHDYRYFPEPDLPLLVVTREREEGIRRSMPELPAARRSRLKEEHQLPLQDVLQLTGGKGRYFDDLVREGAPAKLAANLIMGVVAAKMNELNTDDIAIIEERVPARGAARLLVRAAAGDISSSIAKEVWEKAFASGRTPDQIIESEGLTQIDDESQIVGLIAGVLAANGDAVDQYRGGKTGTFGYLVGQVMKAAGGKMNPKRVNELLKKALGA